jgi:hypothetical protein
VKRGFYGALLALATIEELSTGRRSVKVLAD